MPSSIKIERLQKLILQDVSTIISQGLRDPRLKFGSVTKVDLSDDLRHAKIYVSCLGTEADRRTYMRGLDSARGKIQSIVAKHLTTRVTPHLAFAYDEGIERSIRISALIEKALDEDDASRAARGEPPAQRGTEASRASDAAAAQVDEGERAETTPDGSPEEGASGSDAGDQAETAPGDAPGAP